MLVDSHCHLDYLQKAGADIASILQRAKDADVIAALTIGTKLSQFSDVLAIAESHDNLRCSIGVHPHETDEEGLQQAQSIIPQCDNSNIVGIGESGLDYFYDHSDREVQRNSFRQHIKAARATGLPIIVHTRAADEDTVAILQDEYAQGAFKGVIHCFSTSRWLAEEALKLGFYISLSGILTFNKSQELRDIAADLPLDRLLVETDSPYLAPVPYRGKSNEPSYVVETAAKLAEIRNISVEEIHDITSNNFFTLFDKFTDIR